MVTRDKIKILYTFTKDGETKKMETGLTEVEEFGLGSVILKKLGFRMAQDYKEWSIERVVR